VKRVMVADDDAMIRRTLASALGRSGYEVCTADTGDTALRLAEIATPQVAVIDFNMPSGGIELLQQLKRRFGPALYVAVLTGADDAHTRATCAAAGADAVMAKPLSAVELRRQLAIAMATLHANPPT
jgi:two-component system OmpR family response regulator